MSKKSIQEKLEKVRLSYIATLDKKSEEIDSNWQALNENWDEDIYKNLYMIIHSIAGSAETFGFPDLTAQARTVINQFKQTNSTSSDIIANEEINLQITNLMTALDSAKKT